MTLTDSGTYRVHNDPHSLMEIQYLAEETHEVATRRGARVPVAQPTDC